MMGINVLSKLEEAKKTVRAELRKDRRSIPAMFSGGICLCGKMIKMGDVITRPTYSLGWMHDECAELDASDSKVSSKASNLIEKLADQAIRKQAVWRDDLLEIYMVSVLDVGASEVKF